MYRWVWFGLGTLRATMSWLRAIVCVVLPPLAVLDRGFKPLALTTFLTIFGWIGGVVAALVYSSKPKTV